MTTEDNKGLVRRAWQELMNERDLDAIDKLFTEDYTHHGGGGEDLGREGIRKRDEGYLNAFSDLEVVVEDLVAEGDRVASRITLTGTHDGELRGIPATGRRATVMGTSIVRIENGQIAEEWEVFDQLGLMQQLGVIPTE